MTPTGAQPSPRPDAVDTAGVPEKPSRVRRLVHILGAVLVVLVLPLVVLDALIGKLGADAMVTGLLLGIIGCKLGGTRRMLYLAPAIGLAAGLGAGSAYDWGWVVLLAVVGAIAGGGIRFGWLPPLLMLPFAATFAPQIALAKDAVWYGVIVGLAVLYGVVLARRFKMPAVVEGDREPVKVAVVVAIVFGIGLGASAAIGVALGWTEPYWVPEPILVLTLYIMMGKRDRIQGKAIGTAVGVAAAGAIALLAPPAGVITAIAVVAFLLALTQSKTYWLMYGLYTFALVLALAPPKHIGTEAAHRGSEILIGVGILVVGLAIIHALANWLSKRYPEPAPI